MKRSDLVAEIVIHIDGDRMHTIVILHFSSCVITSQLIG